MAGAELGAQAQGCLWASAALFLKALDPGGKARGGPAPAGGPGNGPAHAARWYFCLACPEPGSATARVRGSSAELEGEKKKIQKTWNPQVTSSQ